MNIIDPIKFFAVIALVSIFLQSFGIAEYGW